MLPNVRLCAVALTSGPLFGRCRAVIQPEQKMNGAPDIQEIKANGDQFAVAFNSNNAAAVAAFYADDSILMLPNQAALKGKHFIRAGLEDFLKQNTASITQHLLETQLAGNWAYGRGIIKQAVTPESRQTDRTITQVTCDFEAAAGWLVEDSPGHGQQ